MKVAPYFYAPPPQQKGQSETRRKGKGRKKRTRGTIKGEEEGLSRMMKEKGKKNEGERQRENI